MPQNAHANAELGRTLDALYWIRKLERDLTETAEDLVAQDPLPITVDQRLANMAKNRALIIDGLEGEYPPMSDGEKFAKAAEWAADGRPPVQVARALNAIVGKPATYPEWINALGMESYLAGEPLLPPSPFEARQKGSDLER